MQTELRAIVHQPSKNSGDATGGTPDPLAAALIRLSLRTRRRAEDEGDHIARMEVYLADLRAWPLKTVLRVLEEWPLRSEFWPTWKELKELRSEFYEAYERPALPPPSAPEHKPFIAKAEPPGLSSKAAWDDHQQALRDLSDPNKPVFGGPSMRATLLKLGKSIEARNQQHAERMGWI